MAPVLRRVTIMLVIIVAWIGLGAAAACAQDIMDPQTKIHFDKKKIKVGNETVIAEIASTPEQLERGLMFRDETQKLKETKKESEGMLFIFGTPRILHFWMKNTKIPLSLGYFDKQKRLIEVQEMDPPSIIEVNMKVYSSSRLAQYALEMPAGWFKRHHIQLRARLKWDD